MARLVEETGPEVLHWLRCWQHYERGHLWRAGGLADQPARYLEAMELLSAEVAQVRADDAERQRARAEAGFGRTGKADLVVHGRPGGRAGR